MSDVIIYYAQNSSYVFEQFLRHFLISIYGVLFASIVAIPLGFLWQEGENYQDLPLALPM